MTPKNEKPKEEEPEKPKIPERVEIEIEQTDLWKQLLKALKFYCEEATLYINDQHLEVYEMSADRTTMICASVLIPKLPKEVKMHFRTEIADVERAIRKYAYSSPKLLLEKGQPYITTTDIKFSLLNYADENATTREEALKREAELRQNAFSGDLTRTTIDFDEIFDVAQLLGDNKEDANLEMTFGNSIDVHIAGDIKWVDRHFNEKVEGEKVSFRTKLMLLNGLRGDWKVELGGSDKPIRFYRKITDTIYTKNKSHLVERGEINVYIAPIIIPD